MFQFLNNTLYINFYKVSPTGRVVFSEVQIFMKKQFNIMTKYKAITTSFNKTIRLSGNHLIHARSKSADTFYPM